LLRLRERRHRLSIDPRFSVTSRCGLNGTQSYLALNGKSGGNHATRRSVLFGEALFLEPFAYGLGVVDYFSDIALQLECSPG
jgi:hypothetical protein